MKNAYVIRVVLTVVVFLVFASCATDKVVSTADALFPLAVEQNIDATALAQAYDDARVDQGVKCLLVSRNGVLVGEEYFRSDGRDSLYSCPISYEKRHIHAVRNCG